jgi:hypothetical protein
MAMMEYISVNWLGLLAAAFFALAADAFCRPVGLYGRDDRGKLFCIRGALSVLTVVFTVLAFVFRPPSKQPEPLPEVKGVMAHDLSIIMEFKFFWVFWATLLIVSAIGLVRSIASGRKSWGMYFNVIVSGLIILGGYKVYLGFQ